MENLFTRKFTTFEFLKFVSPAIISMIFISLYTIIDGIFVSTLVGSDALASINIVLPIINLVCGFGIMMATGEVLSFLYVWVKIDRMKPTLHFLL